MMKKTIDQWPHEKIHACPLGLVDVHVGAKIKLRRSLLNLSQSELAQMLGVTFQQVQKYESGANRVSASRLYHLSLIFDISTDFFFSEAHSVRSISREENSSNIRSYSYDIMERKETVDLIRTYYQIKNSTVRKKFIEMLKSITENKGG